MEKVGGRFLQETGGVHNFPYTALRFAVMTVVTRCQILKLKCTKFDFGCGSAPDPAWGAYSAPPDPLAGFKGPTSKGDREGDGQMPHVFSCTFKCVTVVWHYMYDLSNRCRVPIITVNSSDGQLVRRYFPKSPLLRFSSSTFLPSTPFSYPPLLCEMNV